MDNGQWIISFQMITQLTSHRLIAQGYMSTSPQITVPQSPFYPKIAESYTIAEIPSAPIKAVSTARSTLRRVFQLLPIRISSWDQSNASAKDLMQCSFSAELRV